MGWSHGMERQEFLEFEKVDIWEVIVRFDFALCPLRRHTPGQF